MSETFSPPTSPPRPTLDVSQLPESAFDWRDPVWWGNTILIVIETVTISLILVSYFYLKRNFTVFPPPKIDVSPPIFDTAPRLMTATINLSLMLASCIAMYITDRFARKLQRRPVIVGLLVMLAVGITTCVLRWHEFGDLIFRWNDNAYASVIWVALGMHATYLLAATVEFFLMLAWALFHELDSHHALDVTLCGGYWYWTTAVYVIVYTIVFLSPRWQ